ncbi:MAG: Gfo/Idh/MocA family oxidoreductase [Capsulimonadaceae bacterium]|nr:Gfo/Idh/MocA family oxidoreductase [Capsulimonadaceae bacterium]
MTGRVRIGFVGVGNMGQGAHLRNYVTVPECEVVAIAELRPGLREAVAHKYGIARTYPNADEMIAAEKLDGIVAIQPFDLHGVFLPRLYKAGIPVLTEKPLASSIPDAERILSALADSGTWHMVGYHKRSDPATMYAKAEVEHLKATRELGALKYVRITMPAGDWVANGFREIVRSDEKWERPSSDAAPISGKPYIEFVNYYIHQVNMLRHLLGEPYKVTFADPSGVILAATSQSGVAGIIEMSPYRTTVDWHESALVAFERGWVKIELPAPLTVNRPGRVEVYRDPGSGETPMLQTPSLPWNHAMYQQAVNFIRAVKGEIAPLCTAQEALLDLKNAREYRDLMEK